MKALFKKWWFWIIVVIIIFLILSFLPIWHAWCVEWENGVTECTENMTFWEIIFSGPQTAL